MAPLTLLICDEAKMSKLVGAIAINCGALSGANFMTSGSGIIYRGLMEGGGYADQSFRYTAVIFIASVIFSLLLIAFSDTFRKATVRSDKVLPLINRNLLQIFRRKIFL